MWLNGRRVPGSWARKKIAITSKTQNFDSKFVTGAHHHTTTKRLSKSSTVPPKWNRPDSDLDSDYDLIVHPSVVSHVTSKTSSNPKTSNGKPKVLEQRAGENSGSNLEPTLLTLMLVTLLFFITLTSST